MALAGCPCPRPMAAEGGGGGEEGAAGGGERESVCYAFHTSGKLTPAELTPSSP